MTPRGQGNARARRARETADVRGNHRTRHPLGGRIVMSGRLATQVREGPARPPRRIWPVRIDDRIEPGRRSCGPGTRGFPRAAFLTRITCVRTAGDGTLARNPLPGMA
jgi:hypothetical protein